MQPLYGKRILICRSREDSRTLAEAFSGAGAGVEFFAPFKIRFLPVAPNSPEAKSLAEAERFHWLIFSSPNGVKAWAKAVQSLELPREAFSSLRVGVVGYRAEQAWIGLQEGHRVQARENRLQALVEHIAQTDARRPLRILHPTGNLSSANVPLSPPPDVEVTRLVLYETVLNDEHDPATLERLRRERFDVLVFTSPGGFDFFLNLCGEGGVVRRAAVAVLGETTRRHIQQRGFSVAIVPEAPTPEALVAACEAHFSQTGSDVLTGKTGRRQV
ncbi:MAG: uroporphyrinogen-III synthase [Calditrichaeota bacterium]|nr:MAG: uroporphyrinogen-III synthase [Calditrichota bacterium]